MIHPNYADPDGKLIHSYVIESQGRRIIVDTCLGNDKQRTAGVLNLLHLPFLERLTEVGFSPETIDLVLCTHMHLAHVGWNTRWNGEKWVPTFPNACCLFGREEWRHWSNNPGIGDIPSSIAALMDFEAAVCDSLTPIVEASLHKLVEIDHRLTDEVSLFPTPGHTPGHVSVVIDSDGHRAIIAGDVIHNPIQFADPGICSIFDHDRAIGRTTRTSFIQSNANQNVLVLGTHFATPSAGYIVEDKNGWRFAGDAETFKA
ncbi:MAG TPA: MBL fold metallo-hydrolase [Bryobacteraceae bacterium]|jgi:glyoxylase-like metal-dependent hydrolase (beta-lactamase superfamily II)|nr:MBL fold metallo-hydrolase [Bryobacteraceae bacterium]